MTGTNSNSQPVSTTTVQKSSVTSSSMFVTSPETHLYGGPSVPPDYQSLSGTFSGVASSPWTSPMSSNSGIMYGTSLMNATQSDSHPPSTPIIKQQVGPYISRQISPQQPNPPYVGYPPSRSQFPPSSPPTMAVRKPIVRIPQHGNPPSYSPPYPRMAFSVWHLLYP